jgi:hypothetical protein
MNGANKEGQTKPTKSHIKIQKERTNTAVNRHVTIFINYGGRISFQIAQDSKLHWLEAIQRFFLHYFYHLLHLHD